MIHPLAHYVFLQQSGELLRSVAGPVLIWTRPVDPNDSTGPVDVTATLSSGFAANGMRAPMVCDLGPVTAKVTVGRGGTCTVRITNDSVSRTHLQFNRAAQQWTVCDMNSKNGTWVDGARLAPGVQVAVTDGMRLQLGDVEIRFMLPTSFCSYVSMIPKP